MRHARERKVHRVLVGKSEGRRPLGRPWRRWENWIRMDIRETGWGSVEWIQLIQDTGRWWAPVNTVMNLRVLAPRSKSRTVWPSVERYWLICSSHMTTNILMKLSPEMNSSS
jgi:hypothetical protein